MWIASAYIYGDGCWVLCLAARASGIYSTNLMRARHPTWFREALQRLFGLLVTHAIRPRVAERISFDEVAEAHPRLEAGGPEGKLVLCLDFRLRRIGGGLALHPVPTCTLDETKVRNGGKPARLIAVRRMAAYDAERKLGGEIGSFRFAPES
jgi:hypothetical protein